MMVESGFQSIIGLFPTREDATRAKDELITSGIPAANITIRHADSDTAGEPIPKRHEEGFLDWLFGPSDIPEEHRTAYQSSVFDQGHTLVTVRTVDTPDEFYRVNDILDKHNPINVNQGEHVAKFGTYAPPWPEHPVSETIDNSQTIGKSHAGQTEEHHAGQTEEQRIPTAKEELEVGKRQMTSARTYRIRTVVTEKPVEETVQLRDEKVTVEREPHTGTTASGEPFQEREVEVRETHEEPVIKKIVTPKDDVVIRKEKKDRTETVRDKVRETNVDIKRPKEEMAGNKPKTRR